ncbi:uncharacterized protein A4U43_C02F3450 [Asparagus officinalis]|uniref:Cytochrome P450 n=1 Tax=Asparagus officinalis TaxID=4686 RepID=A0A5P1FGE5_ASPOF|nr:uncharacterized protein A4U43_C02F3450 [Asparagus officinalis]
MSSRPTTSASPAAPTTLSYNCTSISFSPYGDYWRQLKKILVRELLTSKRVKSFSSLRHQEVSNLLKDINNEILGPVNASSKFRELFNTLVARAAFGDKCRQQKRFIETAKEGLRLVTGFNVADLFPSLAYVDVLSGMRSRLERAHHEFDRILDEIIEDHRKKVKNEEEEEEDLVDVLLKVKERSDLEIPITFDNLKAVILDVFVGGTESSAVLTEWTMSELMKHPEMMAKAQDEVRRALKGKPQNLEYLSSQLGELKYLNSVIKETLRLHPPAPLIPRLCRATCTVQGYSIQAGTRVTINVWALGRDPNRWADPEIFKPERFEESSIDFKGVDYELLPFGAGRRICPGITYAMANIELVLAALLLWFDWKLPDVMKPEDLDMTETFSANSGRKKELYLVATPFD